MMAHDGRARDTQQTTLEPRLLPQNAAGQLDSLPLCVCVPPPGTHQGRAALFTPSRVWVPLSRQHRSSEDAAPGPCSAAALSSAILGS